MIFSCSIFSQNALVQLEFEDAEKCYNRKDYKGAVQHIDAVEKKVGTTSKTLYMRIMIENNLLQDSSAIYGSEKGFDSLMTLKMHAKQYLDVMANQGIDEKYRDVYRVQDNIKHYADNKADWQQAQKAYKDRVAENKKNREAIQQLETKHKQYALAREELLLFNRHLITLEQLKYNQLAELITTAPKDAAYCTVYFYRAPKMLGRWVNTKIYINNQLAFPLATKCYKKVRFTPGLLQLNALHGTFKNVEGKRNKKLYDKSLKGVMLEKNKTYYISTEMQKDGSIQYTEIGPTTAREKISDYEPMKEETDFTGEKIK